MHGGKLRLWLVVAGSVLTAGAALAVAVLPDDWRLASRLSTGVVYVSLVAVGACALWLQARRRGGQ